MDLPRSGRSLSTSVWLVVLLASGAFLPEMVQCECARTYPSDVPCGLSLSGNIAPKHRSEAVRGEFPWHVAIFEKRFRSPVYICGGSLVSDRFVLTAAHCVSDVDENRTLATDEFMLQLGYHELGVPDDCTEVMDVMRVYVHPKFAIDSHRHDLALLELARPVRFTDRILPVCVDTDDEDTTEEFYRNVGKVPGWGYTEFDAVSSRLRMTEVPIVNYTRCLTNNPQDFYQTIHDGMFCGGYANGTNVCNGDSGGGLVVFRHGRLELQGIVSFTAIREDAPQLLCDTDQYAGFVKVRYYKAWIGGIIGIGGRPTVISRTGDDRTSAPNTSTEAMKLPTDCGKRRITTAPAIVNGVRSLGGQWPWHVAIFGVSSHSRVYLGGGTLVSANCVLTAASCVADWQLKKQSLVVQLGQAQLWQASTSGREVPVLHVDTSDDSSMALLRLQAEVLYTDYIQPICLPPPPPQADEDDGGSGWTTSNRVGTDGVIVGYGQTDPTGPLSTYLQATLMPIVDSNVCVLRGVFDKSDALKMFCAGHGNGTNACKGDEGGGFYEQNPEGAWTVTGVIGKIKLYHKRCDPRGYVGMADVPLYVEWLTENMKRVLPERTISTSTENYNMARLEQHQGQQHQQGRQHQQQQQSQQQADARG